MLRLNFYYFTLSSAPSSGAATTRLLLGWTVSGLCLGSKSDFVNATGSPITAVPLTDGRDSSSRCNGGVITRLKSSTSSSLTLIELLNCVYRRTYNKVGEESVTQTQRPGLIKGFRFQNICGRRFVFTAADITPEPKLT